MFILVADVAWAAAGLIAAGSILGGQLGATVGRRLPSPVFRGFVAVVGVVVVTTKDAANAVTGRVADAALRAMLAARAGQPIPEPEVTTAVDGDLARRLVGRYRKDAEGFDLTLSGDRLSMLPLEGGEPMRLRALGRDLVVDDRLGYGSKLAVRGRKVALGEWD